MKKGDKLIFKNREEVIVKCSNNRVTGEVVTDLGEYSTDFIMRWIDFGFVKLVKKGK